MFNSDLTSILLTAGMFGSVSGLALGEVASAKTDLRNSGRNRFSDAGASGDFGSRLQPPL
jgi:hypothetical protein